MTTEAEKPEVKEFTSEELKAEIARLSRELAARLFLPQKLERALAEVSRLKAELEGRWIPVGEKRPELPDGQRSEIRLLAWEGCGSVFISEFIKLPDGETLFWAGRNRPVTHWQPLPAPPGTKEETTK